MGKYIYIGEKWGHSTRKRCAIKDKKILIFQVNIGTYQEY